jgi:hypothetical protein
MIQQYGAVICTNGRFAVSATEVFDHLDIPAYPKTSVTGVIHFVHFQKPLLGEDASLTEARDVIAKHMSKVRYAKPILPIYSNLRRFNSQ